MAQRLVAGKLRQSKDAIIAQWVEIVRREVPAASRKDHPALLNSVPDFLDNLAEALDGGDSWQNIWDSRAIGTEHGRQRFDISGYSLKQVLAEYRILRRVVFASMLAELSSDIEALQICNDAFDRGLANAGDSFAAAELERDRKERERFVAAVSHDLRSPIASAKMAVDLMQPSLRNAPEARDFFAILMRNLDQAELLLRDLLDVNRVHSGRRLPIYPEKLELGALTYEVSQDFTSLHGNRFNVDANAKVFGYWCQHSLRRMFDNLLSNAIKYGKVGTPITIHLRQDENSVTILVHNFGQVISPADQSTIFEPFERLKVPGSAEDPGWGLGLAIVKAIAEAHGGAVAVSSLAEIGTTFTVTLPNDARPFQMEKPSLAGKVPRFADIESRT